MLFVCVCEWCVRACANAARPVAKVVCVRKAYRAASGPAVCNAAQRSVWQARGGGGRSSVCACVARGARPPAKM